MRRYLYLGVFFSGFTSLAVELSASRLLGNYFGSSNLVWASIIGLILIYLTIGYSLGGILADKHPNFYYFFSVLCWAALLVGIIPMISRPILRFSSQAFDLMQLGPLFGSFITVLILFSAPVILLGTASPFAIRLAVEKKTSIGNISGQVYALSTLGSFLGTFLPVLIFIPTLGTYVTFLLISAVLLCISLLGLWKTVNLQSAIRYIWMPFLLIILALIGLRGKSKTAQGLIYETESAYNYIQVLEINNYRFLRLNEGQGIQSIYHPSEINFKSYWEEIIAAPFFYPQECNIESIQRMAIVGLAGGTSARQALSVFPNLIIDGYEIDARLIEIGEHYFDMQNTRLNILIKDGRWGISHSSENYQVISIDAFQPPYIPWHLTTQEFFTEVHRHLTNNGVMLINVVRLQQDRRLVDSLYMTIKQVFPSVFVMDIPQTFNTTLFATKQQTNLSSFFQNLSCLQKKINTPQLLLEVLTFTAENFQNPPTAGIILSDDRAPVELLTNQMILKFLSSGNVDLLQ